MVRFVSLWLSLVLCASVGHADKPKLSARFAPLPPDPLTLEPPALKLARNDLFKAHVLRSFGIITAIVATFATAIGAGVYSSSVCLSDNGCGNNSGSAVAGIALIAVGQVAAVSGIAMWAVGQNHANDAERKILSLSPAGVRLTF
jgi:hypothetical protein